MHEQWRGKKKPRVILSLLLNQINYINYWITAKSYTEIQKIFLKYRSCNIGLNFILTLLFLRGWVYTLPFILLPKQSSETSPSNIILDIITYIIFFHFVIPAIELPVQLISKLSFETSFAALNLGIYSRIRTPSIYPNNCVSVSEWQKKISLTSDFAFVWSLLWQLRPSFSPEKVNRKCKLHFLQSHTSLPTLNTLKVTQHTRECSLPHLKPFEGTADQSLSAVTFLIQLTTRTALN